jgi:hypothetical protein
MFCPVSGEWRLTSADVVLGSETVTLSQIFGNDGQDGAWDI